MEIMTSERLVFRTWSNKDFELASALWGDSQVMTYIGKGSLLNDQIQLRLESEIICQQKYGVQYWPIFQKTDGKFIGCCGLKPWIYSEQSGFELGFHLVPSAWGKGFAQEAAREVIQYAKKKSISQLMAGHHPENYNSKKALEKIGFQFVENVFFTPTGLLHPSYKLLI